MFLHRIRPRPFRLVERSFNSANLTHWGDIRLAGFSLPSLSHILPLLLLTQLLFLKFHTDVWLLYFWMPFLHPSGSHEYLTIALAPKLTSASVTTSWLSYCGWDLPDLPVVLVTQTQDAIWRENAIVSVLLEVSFCSPAANGVVNMSQ